MATRKTSKTRSFEIPKEFVGTFFSKLEETELEYTIGELDEDENLYVEVEYTQGERDEVMNLIELLDDYLNEEEEEEEED